MRPSVLFVCLGNICRSPLAEAALRAEAERIGLDVEIDSAGTGDWHLGHAPDPRAIAVAGRAGALIDHLRARLVTAEDFERFDHIVALDAANLRDLNAMRPPHARARLSLLLDHAEGRKGEAVADPYYGEACDFDTAWADVAAGTAGLAARLAARTLSPFGARVAQVTGVDEDQVERLTGGEISEIMLVRTAEGPLVAKGGQGVATEAAMLRTLAEASMPTPAITAELEQLLLLEHVPNDGAFSPAAWTDVGAALKRLHANERSSYGWPADHAIGTVALDNRETDDWPSFWGGQRLLATAVILDRPVRERVENLAARLSGLLPPRPAPALLHGDLWSGNILVREGKLAALIDPACYGGDAEVDLAMLDLFDSPPTAFWDAYGPLEPGWEARRPLYQLFPALVHLRLFGATYAGMVERLLSDAEDKAR